MSSVRSGSHNGRLVGVWNKPSDISHLRLWRLAPCFQRAVCSPCSLFDSMSLINLPLEKLSRRSSEVSIKILLCYDGSARRNTTEHIPDSLDVIVGLSDIYTLRLSRAPTHTHTHTHTRIECEKTNKCVSICQYNFLCVYSAHAV